MSRVAKRRLGDIAVVLISLAFAAVLAVLVHEVGAMRHESEVQSQQLDALEQALGDEQSNVEDLGGEPVAPPPEELLADPEYSPSPGPSGPAGPGPSDAQVYAAVAAYLADNPVTAEGPSSAEIAAAVANYLVDYPPGPTPEQVATAVAAYLTEHPPAAGSDGADGSPGPAGPPGPQGEAGRAPTAEEVAAAVEAFMREHPLPASCPDGYAFEARTLLTLDGPPVEAVICVSAE